MRQLTTIPFVGGETYRLLGRAQQLADGVVCDWSADGLEFTADCEGELLLTVKKSEEQKKTTLKFRVIVDGEPSKQIRINTPGGETVSAWKDLQPGVHTIRIIKDTQVYECTDVLQSATLCCEPGSVKATKKKDKLLLVIGDSDTCGYGVIPTDMPDVTWESPSAYLAYGYRVAAALDMDYEFVSKGTLGVLQRAGSPVLYNYQEMFGYQNRWRAPEEEYAFPRRADAVLYKISGNDNSFPPEEVYSAHKSFIDTVRKAYGEEIPVVLICWTASKHGPVAERLAAEDPTLHLCRLTYDATGMGRHSTAVGHVGYADKIIRIMNDELRIKN